MKHLLSFIIIVSVALLSTSCTSNDSKNTEPNLFTGDSESYTLYQGSDYNVEGIVTFNETKDGFTEIELQITSTDKGLLHPVHIHFSSIEKNGDIAVVLNPVDGETGVSKTLLKEFENGTTVKYADLINLDASVKVHLASTPPEYNTILVGGNIGAAKSKENPFGRYEITVCK